MASKLFRALRKPFLNFKASLEMKWSLVEKEKREVIVFLANYGASAFFLTFLFYSMISGLYENYLILFFDIWVFLVFFEYYYKWLRGGWKTQ